jgi:hypothetical protein
MSFIPVDRYLSSFDTLTVMDIFVVAAIVRRFSIYCRRIRSIDFCFTQRLFASMI